MTMEMGATEMGHLKPRTSPLHLSIFLVKREKEKKEDKNRPGCCCYYCC